MTRVEELILAVEQADSAGKLIGAVSQLAATGSVDAVPMLIRVLGYNNPGAAVAAVEGLIAIGKPAVVGLLERLDGYNYGARAWAVRALSGIGDPRGLDVLLEAAGSDFALSVRRAAARGLGAIHWEDMSSEVVSEAKERTLKTLLHTSEDTEWIVRYATVVGLEGLAASEVDKPNWFTQVAERLEGMVNNDETPAVSARASLARMNLGIS
uniref:Phycocyanin alpha subunit phycocyanobilin lyase subunit F n=2 Tax=Limnospira platensis TaxID=118562 RepID=U6A6A8_LIMPL|nr:phycocyanin alpha subunit phycocyanobilin lyase subunit F [Arthrospira platensis FACHB-350]AHA14841.1 phycocyanin alpha subunit phycocyanobilin lyase subunit F [Arthrospira platensis FACHB-904]